MCADVTTNKARARACHYLAACLYAKWCTCGAHKARDYHVSLLIKCTYWA